jgi:hypothetical protein
VEREPDSEPRRTKDDITAITVPRLEEDAQEPVFELAAHQKKVPFYKTRTSWMFGILLLLFTQYLLFFGGNGRISQVVPLVYDQMADSFRGFLGEQ